MKSISLHGSYYGDNFGDTLFVLYFVEWLKEKEVEPNKIYLPFASKRVRELVKVSQIKGIKSILKSDLIAFFGGGYLGEPSSSNKIWPYRLIIRHLAVALLAYILKKPYAFIGVGAGPLTNRLARKLTVFLCKNSEKLIVRDIESKEYLVSYGVPEEKIEVTVDSILTLTSKDVNVEEAKKIKNKIEERENLVLIGVHLPVKENEIEPLEKVIIDLKNYCNKNFEDNYKIIVFNDFYKENYEYKAWNLMKENFNSSKLVYEPYNNPEKLIALINELDIVITTKLHCGIVANSLGKYTLSISVHNKTVRLYKQLGLRERNVSLNEYKKGELEIMLKDFNSEDQPYENVPQNIRDLADKNKQEFINFALRR